MWESLPERERATSLVPKLARELLEWARDVTIVQHTLARKQLLILEKARPYQPAGQLESRSRAIEVRA